jgi:ubiquinone biosynthesis protein
MPFKLIKDIKDINRFREILTVLFEEGFDFIIEKIRLKHKVPITKRVKARIKEKKSFAVEKRLRLTLERLGPTFIKFGQMLSVRPDLIPKSYIKELERLQDKVPEFSYDIVQQQIKKELGKDIKEIFKEFEKKPIASASISQVHKAVLKDGSKVAVKIQRPEAKRLMQEDVEIMLYFAKLLEKHFPNIVKYHPVKIIQEFASWTSKELNFVREAANAKLFYHNFKNIKTVKIPKIYNGYVTEKILVLEFIDGTELHNIKEIKRKKLKFDQVIKNGFDAVLTQVFMHGFFHADPHPGNILVLKNNVVAFVDFGIVGYFDDKLKDRCISLFYGIVENDLDMIVDSLMDIGIEAENIDKEELKYEISLYVEPLQKSSLKDVKVSRVLEEVMSIALNYGLKIPLPFVLFGKTIVTLEGIGLEYDKNFKIIEASRPFIEKLVKQRSSPAYIVNNFIKNALKFKKFAETLPEETEKALKKIQKGTIKVDIADTDIRQLSKEIDRSSNRVSYALIITALLIVGAILMPLSVGPIILNIPILSLLSFLGAGFLTLILFFSIVNEAK